MLSSCPYKVIYHSRTAVAWRRRELGAREHERFPHGTAHIENTAPIITVKMASVANNTYSHIFLCVHNNCRVICLQELENVVLFMF